MTVSFFFIRSSAKT